METVGRNVRSESAALLRARLRPQGYLHVHLRRHRHGWMRYLAALKWESTVRQFKGPRSADLVRLCDSIRYWIHVQT